MQAQISTLKTTAAAPGPGGLGVRDEEASGVVGPSKRCVSEASNGRCISEGRRLAGPRAWVLSSSCRWLDGDPGDGRETLDGYEQGRQGPGQHSFAELLASARWSVIRLEMRGSYDPAGKGFAEWQATGDTGAYEWGDHLGVVRAAVARGVRIRRVRVVSEPLSEYLRWEHALRDQILGFAVNSWRCATRPAAGRTRLAITAFT